MDVEPVIQEQDLRSKITAKPVVGPSSSSDAIFASNDIRFQTANQLAINKLNAEKWKKKMQAKFRKNKIAAELREYERKFPANPSGARKASANHSPERRGRKRERSSSYYSTCCESLSPPRWSRPSRTPCSP